MGDRLSAMESVCMYVCMIAGLKCMYVLYVYMYELYVV